MMGDDRYVDDDPEFVLGYVRHETNIEVLYDRLVNAVIYEKYLVEALRQRISELELAASLAANESTA